MSTEALLFIIGFILAAVGIVALVAAYRLRIASLQESQQQRTDLAVRTTQLNNIQNDLVLTQTRLEDATTERDNYKSGVDKITGSLVALGVIHPDTDVLALTQADLIIDAKSITRPTPPQTTGEPVLPTVPGFTTTQDLRAALIHASNQTGPRSDRPFSRRYMVDNGPLTRSQLDHLISVLLDYEYVTLKGDKIPVPVLTPRGQRLLNKVKLGEL